ncbi:MAG: SHOCT domain-containing protein [Candidatus Delongbacteria bacterium]|jgi:uncharacterized membrane protein|nr:SHOCT domain-containing protein [Candidatus Delongbacteria bacterium]
MKNLVTIILIAINLVFAHSDGWMNEGMMHGNGYSYFMIILVILITLSLLYLIKNMFSHKSVSAIDILNSRLARNEITVEEFRKLKSVIDE